jgi:hypothetical protein
MQTVRVAAIQATPVILDADACVAKAIRLFEEAAGQGAQLAVLPETFIPLYPSNRWAKGAAGFSGWDELWERMHEHSVEIPGPYVDELVAACRRLKLHAVVPVNERDGGSLYNTFATLGPNGLLHKHRKLMPTQQERLFHGIGAGTDLQPVDTALGRIGGLICWENRMPLARWAVYRVRGVRRLGSPVHPRQRVPGRLPGPGRSRRRLRPRRGGDRRADLGRGDRRAGVRHGDRSRGRLRPAGRVAREALVRRGGPLLQDGRPHAQQLTAGRRALCRRLDVRVPRPEISRPLRP